MNWKKALLVVLLGGFALVFLVVALVGFVATAAVTTAAVAISESGVVEAFEEVADGAEQLQVDVDGQSITFTNLDNGESRVIFTDERGRSERVEFSLPKITIIDAENGESLVIVPGLQSAGEVIIPEITITDPDSGQSRVIIPDTTRFETERRVPRVVWDGDYDWSYGPEHGLWVVGAMFRGLFTLIALTLIAAGAFLLLRNRRQVQVQDKVDKSD
jgi:hypothetical protein